MCPLSVIELDLHWLCILRIILVSWYLVVNLDYSCNATLRAWRFLGASIVRRTLCQKIDLHIFKLRTSEERNGHQCARYCSEERHFAGIVILGLVLALVLAQERQDNMTQHPIHVGLADQVSLHNYQICRPQCLTSPEGHGKR